MEEPFYTVLRVLHVGGGWLAFGAAPFALRAVKGGQHHKLAGRCFVACMGTGVIAGILLATVGPDFVRDLFLLGLMTLFFLGTGYLAPRIGRGSRPLYQWDRALTGVGFLASVASRATACSRPRSTYRSRRVWCSAGSACGWRSPMRGGGDRQTRRAGALNTSRVCWRRTPSVGRSSLGCTSGCCRWRRAC